MRLFTAAEWAGLTHAQRAVIHMRRRTYVRAAQNAHERTYRAHPLTPARQQTILALALHRHRLHLPDHG